MILIDVRTPQEFQYIHADGSINFPLEYIQAGRLPDLEKNEEIAVYCRSGARSETAKNLLIQKGFTKVTNAGGLRNVL